MRPVPVAVWVEQFRTHNRWKPGTLVGVLTKRANRAAVFSHTTRLTKRQTPINRSMTMGEWQYQIFMNHDSFHVIICNNI